MVAEAERYKAEDDANRQRVEAKNGLENYAFNLRNSLNDEKLKDKITEADKTMLNGKIDDAISWLDNNQSSEKEEFEEKQKELEAVANPIMAKLYQGGGGMPDGMPGGFPGGFPGTAGGRGAPSGGSDEGPKIEEVD